jgi:hypothetical protein
MKKVMELTNNNYNFAAVDPELDRLYLEHALAVAQTGTLPVVSDVDSGQIQEVVSPEDKSNESS